MAPVGRYIASATACLVIISGCIILSEIEITAPRSNTGVRDQKTRHPRADYGKDILINPIARLPNEGRKGAADELGNDVGTRSVHNGAQQRERQLWLHERADQLRAYSGDAESPGNGEDSANVGGENSGEGNASPERGEADAGEDGAEVVSIEERLHRMERGVELWGATYVPPIAPDERRGLLEKWTAPAGGGVGERGGAPRILFVVTSFDRGKRLQVGFRGMVDKLDYILMIMDEIREACEAGFTPQVHVISAWDARREETNFLDRLYCRRSGQTVPITFEEHSPRILEALSIKHRVYMKPRVDDHDLFVQVEDDMIFTVNHVLRYLEESEKLSLRNKRSVPNFDFMPGFIRVEPGPSAEGRRDSEGETSGVGGEWFEWEIILSRFRGATIAGAGTYLTLDPSRVLPFGGNNQGMWAATRGQLQHLRKKCRYLRYTEKSNLRHVEKFSGSLEMFSFPCHTTKVFPAARFEDFLVHHRTNNKNGQRGESLPAVSVSILRFMSSQVLRDSGMLPEIG